MSSVHKRAFTGVIWSAIESLSQFFVRFGVQLVLARMVGPEAFGLIAMVTVFDLIGVQLMDAGFNQVVVQKKELSQLDLNTVFYTNAFLGSILTALLYFLAVPISEFYQEPVLKPVLQVICLCIFFSALSRVHVAIMTRELRYRCMTMATLPAKLIAGGAAIYLASIGMGIWALASYILLQPLLSCVALWIVSPWAPTFSFSLKSLKSMLPFGLQLMATRILNIIGENLIFLVIGKVYTPVVVGYYQRADVFRRAAAEQFAQIFIRVIYPMMARIQGDLPRMRAAHSQIIVAYTFFFSFSLGGLAGFAQPLISVVLGDEWLATVPYLQLLCILGFVNSMNLYQTSLQKAAGNGERVLKLTLAERCVRIGLLLILARMGVIVIISGQIAGAIIGLILRWLDARRFLKIPISTQFYPLAIPGLIGVGLYFGCEVAFRNAQTNLQGLVFATVFIALLSSPVLILLRLKYRSSIILLLKQFPCLKHFERLFA